MTELAGAHCGVASCRQLDFLPFRCDSCGVVYCEQHRSFAAHSCKAAIEKDRRVPQCPLCQQLIPIGRDDDVNARVDAHITAGCPVESSTVIQRDVVQCYARGCDVQSISPIICRFCGRCFCVRHRLPTDHRCEAPESAIPSAAEALAPARAAAQAAMQRAGFSVGPASSGSTAGAGAAPAVTSGAAAAAPSTVPATVSGATAAGRRPVPKSGMALQVALMKMRMSAKGDERIPAEQRLFYELNVDASVQPKATVPKAVFFSKEWTVGRSIDFLATLLSASNVNHVAHAPKLFLETDEGERLAPDAKWEWVADSLLPQGRTVRFVREAAPQTPSIG